ncbi:hypothetical protein MPSEU_000794800 [Mayamaea pseudoterrestris]|nr:hypothetical protein MPSEU_000794800 [Mayamaea pseudoterrestris]
MVMRLSLCGLAWIIAQANVTLVAAWLSHQRKSHISFRSIWSIHKRQAVADQQLGSFESLLLDETGDQRRVLLESYLEDDALVPFSDAWRRQKELLQDQVDRIKRDLQSNSFVSTSNIDSSRGCDRILMLQHAPVYTLGTASDERYILSQQSSTSSTNKSSGDTQAPADTLATSDIPIVRMDRGGEVTYHGPGQLVVYPILDLRSYRQDIHWYMRALEQVVLLACQKLQLSRPAVRQDDTTGIWIDNYKIAAMGVKCSRWITQHGLAVNVEETSLRGFDGIVPCGLEGRKVGSLNQFLDEPITVREFAVFVQEALEEVFGIQLVDASHFKVCS